MNAEALHAEGTALLSQQDRDGAIPKYEAALALDPLHLPSLVDLGVAKYWQRDYARAIELFTAALTQRPNDRAIAINLAHALADDMRHVAAERLWRALIADDPSLAHAHYQLGSALMWQMRHREAREAFRHAIDLSQGPVRRKMWRAYLNAFLYDDAVHPQEIRSRNAEFVAELPKPETPVVFANSRDPGRKLRIGYSSADFRAHSAARSFRGLFEFRDRANFEIHVYSEAAAEDGVTREFRALADGWRSTVGLDGAQAAAMIRADGIDVLVTMAQHFDDNRLDIPVMRAAPVQINAFDVATSGSDVFDAFLAEPTMAAARGDAFTERVMRSRRVYVHAPLEAAPPVAVPPSAAGAAIAFGSANNPIKISGRAIMLWSRVLAAVPGSTLRLKFYSAYREEATRLGLLNRFAAHGIGPDRIVFELGGVETDGHLRFYERVDVALDATPFTGSTTTFEALWMGVPVVTPPGRTILSRWTAGMLTRVGRADLIATSDEHFVKLAAEQAAKAKHQDRAALREAVRASALCDPRKQARDFERIYRALWRRYCAKAGA